MRRSRNQTRQMRWIKYVRLAAFFIVLGGGIGLLTGYYQRQWRGRERFTVINLTEGVVASYDPESNSGVRIKLPDELELDTVSGKGKWRVKALPSLAEKYGKKWAADSVANNLAVFYTGIEEDLGLWDRWQWWRIKSQVRWEEVDLEDTTGVKELKAADEVRIWTLADWESKAARWFVSSRIANESLAVTIVNTVGVSGLGANAARVLETSGMKVTQITQEETAVGRCIVKSNKNTKQSDGVGLILRSMGCIWEEEDEVDGEVKLLLGEEYRRWWQGS